MLLVSVPAAVQAQSLLDRSPNVSGDWTANPGTIQFNFTHRFVRSGAPERKVSNFPTFMVGIGLPKRTMVGFGYATNSTLAPRYPNEWEFFVRHGLLSELEGHPMDLGGQFGYNLASEGVDGEVSAAKRLGPARLVAVTRVIANPYVAGRTQLVVGGGATLKLSNFIALSGDLASITNKETGKGERDAWSAGLHVAIPNTPHTLSFQATNTNTSTLQGASRGEDRIRYGFEFTIPVTLARYFSRSKPAPAAPDSAPAAVETPPARPDSNPPVGARPAAPAPAPDSTPGPVEPTRANPGDSVPIPKPVAAVEARPATPPPTPAPAPAKPVVRTARATMKGLNFLPKRIEITAGTVLVWKNDDPLVHTVTAVDKSFDSGSIAAGATWRRAFTKPGTYQVTCTPHPFMKATIVVKAEP